MRARAAGSLHGGRDLRRTVLRGSDGRCDTTFRHRITDPAWRKRSSAEKLLFLRPAAMMSTPVIVNNNVSTANDPPLYPKLAPINYGTR
jgi:hypothetical protein